ncbi:MAG: DUF1538 domain-containing protein [Pseudomonadota bacterium]
MAPSQNTTRYQLGLRDTLRVLWPYAKRQFLSQLSGIWFIVAYLAVFQILVLKLPIAFAGMIVLGILIVIVGLMFFMEGLRLGLMPLGETIGTTLPKRSHMGVILSFAFVLGVGATFAEPAIAVLKTAGAGIVPAEAPLLYSLLNDFSGELVAAVGIGVGFAVVLGALRFFYLWPLKWLAIPTVGLLLGLSFYCSQVAALSDLLGLAWDCGAVTTGPVTVPLVLALGIGISRAASGESGSGGNSGFGIVTLASLFPILAVLLLGILHFFKADYWGAENYSGVVQDTVIEDRSEPTIQIEKRLEPISDAEFQAYLATGRMPEDYEISIRGGSAALTNGKIEVNDPQLMITKVYRRQFSVTTAEHWDRTTPLTQLVRTALLDALRAIIPLCLLLYLMLRFVLRERLNPRNDVGVGVLFAFAGMALFGLGIALGLMPLGSQLGSNVPIAFAEIFPSGLNHVEGPLFSSNVGKWVAIGFAFLLGYGATLAEPALNALGDTVERITVGAFRKRLLMQSVAFGVGLGIAAGVMKITYGLPLFGMLMPAYLLVMALTKIAPDEFVNFSWDSAGVTTGPITVPLVLAMGLGIGANIPGASDGFGILALASVGPILTVLAVGLYTHRNQQKLEAVDDVKPIRDLVEAESRT